MIYLSIAVTNNPDAMQDSLRYQNHFEKQGLKVFNPVTYFHNTKLTEFEIMMKCFKIIKFKCKKLVVLPYSKTSKGVQSEIAFCRKFDIPVLEIKSYWGKLFTKESINHYEITDLKIIIEKIRIFLGYEIRDFYYVRKPIFSEVRSCLCKLLREDGYTLLEIASVFNKHHSSIIHNLQKYHDFIKIYPDYRELYQKLKTEYENLKIAAQTKNYLEEVV